MPKRRVTVFDLRMPVSPFPNPHRSAAWAVSASPADFANQLKNSDFAAGHGSIQDQVVWPRAGHAPTATALELGETLAMLWLYQQLRLLRTAFCTKDSPRQMAAGIACGLMLGLLPKGNLLAVAVATLLFSTRMSLATGLLCAFLVSALAPLLDPVTHRLGQWLLTGPALVPLWQRLSRVPFAAWSAFNNTVVMGNLALGLLLMYPVYRSSLPWMERLRSRWGDDGSVGEDLTATDNTLDDPPQTILLFKDEDAPAAESVLDQRRSCA